MSKGKASEKEMIGVLKQIEAGQTAAGVTRGVGVPKHTIHAWKVLQVGTVCILSDGSSSKATNEEDTLIAVSKHAARAGFLKSHRCRWEMKNILGGQIQAKNVEITRMAGALTIRSAADRSEPADCVSRARRL